MKIFITLKLFATLKSYEPYGVDTDQYPVQPGMTIQDLVDELGMHDKEAKLIFVNGVRVPRDMVLQGGERVGIFPPVGGG